MRWVVSCVAATVCAAERAMGWGKRFNIRPPDKDDGVPQGVSRGMWGSYADRRSVSSTTERCPARTKSWEPAN